MAEHEAIERVAILGSDGKEHLVPADRTEEFFHGSDGRPISDAEWDEMQARKREPLVINADDYKVEPEVAP